MKRRNLSRDGDYSGVVSFDRIKQASDEMLEEEFSVRCGSSSRRKPILIMVVPDGEGYKAYVRRAINTAVYGKTREEAIGGLVLKSFSRFGVRFCFSQHKEVKNESK